jgi:voltage-gated potassium channel
MSTPSAIPNLSPLSSDPLFRRVFRFSCLVAAALVLGTLGYMAIEGWSTQDGFYMSVITLATVGYGETQELSGVGRLFNIFRIFISIVCLSCWKACLKILFV